MPNRRDLTVALAGFGAVGRAVARRLDQGIPGLKLAAISARDGERARSFMRDFHRVVPVEPLERLPSVADIVVECLPPNLLVQIAEPTLRAGRTLIVISCGALLDHPQLRDLAIQHDGRIIVPTGALIGLDAMQAAMEGVITSVRMVTRKPPRGLVGAPYLVEHAIDLAGLREPLKLFSGSARDGVRGFPANVNVAAALSLAGIGPDETIMEIWADPSLDRNTHAITVESDSASFSMSISNIPTEENPKTGKITALSVIATLRRLTAPLRIGT